MTASPQKPPTGTGTRPTSKTCPNCAQVHPAEIQTLDGREIIVGTCPRCYGAEAEFSIELETVTKPCKACGKDYTTQLIDIAGRKVDFGRFCELCTLAQQHTQQRAKQDAFIAGRKAAWEIACPDYYRTDAIVGLLPPEKKKAVQDAIREGKGCLIHGPSGAFKTTAMFHGAVKKLIWDRKEVLFISAMEWKPACSAAAKECTQEKFLRPFVTAPWLFLDDVGNMGGTPASIEALHSLLEQRMRRSLPVLATTQYAAKDLIARMSTRDQTTHEAGIAIVRRLSVTTGTSLKFT